MKYKKMIAYLKAKQKVWDAMKPNDQHASTRTGSVKTR